MEFETFLIRLGAAFLSGILIGLEREMKNKKAGMRTNTLVAIGAAVYVLIAIILSDTDSGAAARVVGQVVTGIGFLGAGVILHRESDVIGITTAATIWCSAAMGCLSAFGMFKELAACTLMILIVNGGMMIIEERFYKK